MRNHEYVSPGVGEKVALKQATNLSDSHAYEIWHALQLIVNDKSLNVRPVVVAQLEMEFHAFPVLWKVIADKALENGRLHREALIALRGLWISNRISRQVRYPRLLAQ